MEIEEAPAHQKQIYMALRNERRSTARELTSCVTYHSAKRNRIQRLFKARDLVTVRHHAIDSQRGRKLKFKWLRPRLLVQLTPSGNSGYVQQLHDDGTTKKYHINDILLYKKRGDFTKEGIAFTTSPRGTRPMIINGRGTGNPEVRAVLLSVYHSQTRVSPDLSASDLLITASVWFAALIIHIIICLQGWRN